MKDKLIIEDYDEPVQSLTFFNFIYNQDDNNNNNDHLLCGIIEDLWASEDSFIENIFKPQNNCSKKNCSNNEEINELQAYLYEIDMNLEYFRNDYREFKNYDLDINIDKLLSFSCSQDACNMLIYETEISYKLRLGTNKIQLSDIFAHVEDIPEFIPINYSNDISSDTEVLDEHQLIYDDDGILVDEFLNDDFQVGVGGDIFENVYNYIPDGDGDEDEEDEEEIGVSTTSSDDNSSGSAKKTMSKKSQKSLSAYYFRKKLALQLDIDNSSLKLISLTDDSFTALTAFNWNNDFTRQFFIANLTQPFKAGHNYTVSMKYVGYLTDDNAGFYRSSYINENNDTVWLMTSQLESTDARKSFPCFDEPAMKAQFTIRAIHQNNYTALSNMPEEQRVAV